jgi:hypothetical protein
MTSELRLYTVREGRLDTFLHAWLAGVPRLRRAHGFEIGAVWVARDANRFFWILSHPGDRAEFERADKAYYASPERRALRPDPADELVAMDHLFVEPVTLDDTPAIA